MDGILNSTISIILQTRSEWVWTHGESRLAVGALSSLCDRASSSQGHSHLTIFVFADMVLAPCEALWGFGGPGHRIKGGGEVSVSVAVGGSGVCVVGHDCVG